LRGCDGRRERPGHREYFASVFGGDMVRA